MGDGGRLPLDPQAFLRDYWQRKPLLLRGAVPGFRPPLSADELAGLALEPEVESRIVEHAGAAEWRLQHGPFCEPDFRRQHPWTLLVQAVDHYLPEVAALRRLVDFIPQWRVDDVMVSYAVDGGSVGPHYDNYDVFLLQGEGRRLWRVGQPCDADTALLPHPELRILRDFECRDEYLLEPGDMLYLPPRVAHWGVAQGECTTFSIGFRAPRLADIVSRFADALLGQFDAEGFYRDAGMTPARRQGEIRPEDLRRVHGQLQAALDSAPGDRWFGELVTEPRYEVEAGNPADALEALRGGGSAVLALSGAAKLAWMEEAGQLLVFANGDSRAFAAALTPCVEGLCRDGEMAGAPLAGLLAAPGGEQLLHYLLETGCLYVE